ncbi:DUF262 domain-containing protein [Sphingobacterium sp. WM]|uniref:DUF262 domain-containing protein n=1 Tax=Sphingobacterium sp. WM TaxID=3031802 RepID=UPI00240D434F|nr:DUF262 domain-containing protein [Sphingobacterium sp. WM]WFB62123.1 DUF262 domain-containing protein [Sphingobacterium sp. WM]
MQKFEENVLEPRLIGEITLPKNNYRFFIPSYQRGYRWGIEEVTALLEDLLEFNNTVKDYSEKYCLQPIVVKQLESGEYEVLDGQQRLTTIYILLSYLKRSYDEITLFTLSYETRSDSAKFLKNLNHEINDQNPDYYYISQAFLTISKWFDDKVSEYFGLKMDLVKLVLKQVEIIWYEIKDNSNPIDVFTRINIGKIPLTNSELVKAVFLSKNNLQLGLKSADTKIDDIILNNKQSVIGLEWDAMEKELQDNNFWSFIFNKKDNNYQTRIDYILDLVTESSINAVDSLEAFKKYYNKIKSIRNNAELLKEYERLNTSYIEEEWALLKAYFDILLEWYNNKWYNHIIGYLISRNENIIELLNQYKNLNRAGFKKELISKIEKGLSIKKISELRFENSGDKKALEDILLLHNVVGSLIQPDTSIHFPFHQIKIAKWSLEHIYAQNTDDLLEKDYESWVNDHLNYFKSLGHNNDDLINSFIEKLDTLQGKKHTGYAEEYKESFKIVFSEVEEYFRRISDEDRDLIEERGDEYQWVSDVHSLANLTLLDISANSYLSNSIFGVKRKKIKDLDKRLAFIPNETRKVFFKYYSNAGSHDAYWSYADRIAYVTDIESKINNLNNLLDLK